MSILPGMTVVCYKPHLTYELFLFSHAGHMLRFCFQIGVMLKWIFHAGKSVFKFQIHSPTKVLGETFLKTCGSNKEYLQRGAAPIWLGCTLVLAGPGSCNANPAGVKLLEGAPRKLPGRLRVRPPFAGRNPALASRTTCAWNWPACLADAVSALATLTIRDICSPGSRSPVIM